MMKGSATLICKGHYKLMDVNKKHIEKSNIKKILSDYSQEVQPFMRW